MSLDHAILGFLNYGPSSGYGLKKAFDNSVRHFWPADQNQIYRTLRRMAQQGWVELELVEQVDRPDRKVYHLTNDGRDELRRWLATPLPPDDNRRASLIQVFFAGQLSDEEILHVLETKAAQTRVTLERYRQIPQGGSAFAQAVGSEREVFFWQATLQSGIRRLQADLEWLEELIQQIQQAQHASS
jgi:DNA-binding PadR family transcriptional regulator